VATQKVPLTRIDETGASDGKVLKYSSGVIAWGDDASGGGGGSGTAFKNTILATDSVSANSLEQYQVHSGLEILSGGTFTIAASGDLILDAPDDPNKAAGWTDMGAHIATTDTRDSVCIGTHTQLSTDDKLSVAGGNLTVAGSISAQSDVYGNARTMTNPGVILQVIESVEESGFSATASTWVDTGLEITITPTSTSSKVLLQATWQAYFVNSAGQSYRYTRDGTSLDTPGAAHGLYTDASSAYYMPSLQHLDSPNTTSAVVYKLQVQGYNSNLSHFNYNSHFRTSMVAMEIAG
jgi:hypothetical protein